MSGLKEHLVRVDPVEEDDALSKFAGTLVKHGAVPVEHKGNNANGPIIERGTGRRLSGLIHADLVADREHPRNAKARSMVSRSNTVDINADVAETVTNLIESHVRALPVVSGDDYVGLVTERSLMDLGEIIDDRRPIDTLASNPITIPEDSTVGHARAQMRDHRIGRLPVVDDQGLLVGLVEWNHLVQVETHKDNDKRLLAQEPVPSPRLPVTTIMDAKPLTVGTKDPAGDIARAMKDWDRSSAVLIEDKRPVGIITCEDLLEPVAARFARTTPGLYVQITGLDGVDPFDRSTVDRLVKENLNRFIHDVKDPEYLYLHVKSYKEEGNRRKWSIRARLADGKGTLNARSHGYDLMEAIDESFERMGRIVHDHRELRREHQRNQSSREARKQGF